jgi:PhnB protein
LTAHLTVKGCADYIDFLKRAFNAVEIARMAEPTGKVMHAQVRIGDTSLMLNDDFPEYGHPPIAEGHWPLALHFYVPDADAAFAQATAAGCQVAMLLAGQFWGDRYGQVKDPSGFTWSIATHTEDLTPAEMQERQTKMFGGAGA